MRASILVLALAAALGGCKTVPDSATPNAGAAPVTEKPQPVTEAIPDVRVRAVVPDTPVKSDEAGLDLKKSVYYEFDRYDVKPEYRALVERHASWLRSNPRARLVIVGNTDERGTSEYNLALGQRRAESVTRMLMLLGAKEEQVEAVSFGKEKPRAGGHDETAWAENRRSDFSRP